MINESNVPIPGMAPKLPVDKTKVTVCVSGYTFNGYVQHIPQQRILDSLNKGVVAGQPRATRAFLQITEAEVIAADGQKEAESTTSYIGKQSILFVIDREGGQRRTDAVKRQLVGYPIRAKKKVRARIRMPAYTITGMLHTENWQKLDHLLETEENFLPVTDAEITPPVVTGDTRVDFVAVNKAHIIFLLEAPEPK